MMTKVISTVNTAKIAIVRYVGASFDAIRLSVKINIFKINYSAIFTHYIAKYTNCNKTKYNAIHKFQNILLHVTLDFVTKVQIELKSI